MDASLRDALPNENTPLGPFLGNLPVDVLRVVLGLLTPFERAGGACYRVAKQSGLGLMFILDDDGFPWDSHDDDD